MKQLLVNPERDGFHMDAVTSTSGNELKDSIIYGSYTNGNLSAWVTSCNDWPNGMPTSGTHPNSFSVNPLLVNPAQAGISTGFNLGSGSPCINPGTSVGVTTDVWGTARDASPDIGFHEHVAGPPQPPVASFSGNPTSGSVPLTVAFTDQSTNSPTSWSWTFGDSTTSTAQNPSHTYGAAGTYTVALTSTNAYGSNTNTKTNYISVSSGGGASSHVGGLVMTNASPPNYTAKATVTAHDQNHTPLAGATVYGTWSGAVSGSRNGTTDANGVVGLNSPRGSAGTYTFTVTNIVKTGYTYGSASNHITSNSTTLP